jgi:hypothetical protein
MFMIFVSFYERLYSQCNEVKACLILASTGKTIKERSINYDGIGNPAVTIQPP